MIDADQQQKAIEAYKEKHPEVEAAILATLDGKVVCLTTTEINDNEQFQFLAAVVQQSVESFGGKETLKILVDVWFHAMECAAERFQNEQVESNERQA